MRHGYEFWEGFFKHLKSTGENITVFLSCGDVNMRHFLEVEYKRFEEMWKTKKESKKT